MTTVRYFAAAAEAAGVDSEPVTPGTWADVRSALLVSHPALAAVLPRCAVLADGVRLDADDDDVRAGAVLDVLPPFAGG
ncbi:MoaD/ThiS family protein [Cellulomonas sp. HZM]|uniref:MoaD/ThiS family protein n=1 Tax=Cellulomonas sp. HZM TaxID=1454010 RepID=UPI0004935862|nr:MoaD/ThiS family protein [Cellulomonas sp. HZM]